MLVNFIFDSLILKGKTEKEEKEEDEEEEEEEKRKNVEQVNVICSKQHNYMQILQIQFVFILLYRISYSTERRQCFHSISFECVWDVHLLNADNAGFFFLLLLLLFHFVWSHTLTLTLTLILHI